MSGPENTLATVVVCTYNGLADLKELVGDLLEQKYDNYEIMVVDNNSTDGTLEYLRETAHSEPRLRYCREPQQGKSFALNRSILESRGEIVAFVDQDCCVQADWLERIVLAMRETGADGVGGIVEMALEGEQSWLTRELMRADILPGAFNQGDRRRETDWVMGCNMAFRREVFEHVPNFDTAVVEYGLNKGYGHEVDFCDRVVKAGYRLVYDPSILVRHKIPPSRQTLSYAISSNFWIAASNSLIQRPLHYHGITSLHPLKFAFDLVYAAGRLYAFGLKVHKLRLAH